jgi:hypothetical protein
LLYDWRFTANEVVLAKSPLRLTTSNFTFQSNTCGCSLYITSSLATAWVCRLQNCCRSSPAQSFWGPSPAGLKAIFYCLRFETSPTLRARSPYLHPPGTGWPGYTPRHCVPFSSPRTTRRATVDVFERASTRDSPTQLISPTVLVITSRHGLHRKHRPTVACVSVAAGTSLLSLAQKRSLFIRPSRGRCTATAVRAKIYNVL